MKGFPQGLTRVWESGCWSSLGHQLPPWALAKPSWEVMTKACGHPDIALSPVLCPSHLCAPSPELHCGPKPHSLGLTCHVPGQGVGGRWEAWTRQRGQWVEALGGAATAQCEPGWAEM